MSYTKADMSKMFRLGIQRGLTFELGNMSQDEAAKEIEQDFEFLLGNIRKSNEEVKANKRENGGIRVYPGDRRIDWTKEGGV
jgi:hypothetical protein